jgi:hypothetical protein
LEPVLPITLSLSPYALTVCAMSMMCSSHDMRWPSPATRHDTKNK